MSRTMSPAAERKFAALLPGITAALSFSAADVFGKIVFNDGAATVSGWAAVAAARSPAAAPAEDATDGLTISCGGGGGAARTKSCMLSGAGGVLTSGSLVSAGGAGSGGGAGFGEGSGLAAASWGGSGLEGPVGGMRERPVRALVRRGGRLALRGGWQGRLRRGLGLCDRWRRWRGRRLGLRRRRLLHRYLDRLLRHLEVLDGRSPQQQGRDQGMQRQCHAGRGGRHMVEAEGGDADGVGHGDPVLRCGGRCRYLWGRTYRRPKKRSVQASHRPRRWRPGTRHQSPEQERISPITSGSSLATTSAAVAGVCAGWPAWPR